MPNLTKGIYTSEFWQSTATAIIGLLVMWGIIKPADATDLNANVATIAGGTITVISGVSYLVNRYLLKRQVLNLPAAPPISPAYVSPPPLQSTSPATPAQQLPPVTNVTVAPGVTLPLPTDTSQPAT